VVVYSQNKNNKTYTHNVSHGKFRGGCHWKVVQTLERLIHASYLISDVMFLNLLYEGKMT